MVSHILTCVFQQSLDSGCVPDGWKVTKIIPIFEYGDASPVNNYRPISLTIIPCNLFKHIISAVMKCLKKHKLFINQHGFQQGRSCEVQQFELASLLYEAIGDLSRIGPMFIDFAKAFNKIAHKRLLMKLCYFNNIARPWIG